MNYELGSFKSLAEEAHLGQQKTDGLTHPISPIAPSETDQVGIDAHGHQCLVACDLRPSFSKQLVIVLLDLEQSVGASLLFEPLVVVIESGWSRPLGPADAGDRRPLVNECLKSDTPLCNEFILRSWFDQGELPALDSKSGRVSVRCTITADSYQSRPKAYRSSIDHNQVVIGEDRSAGFLLGAAEYGDHLEPGPLWVPYRSYVASAVRNPVDDGHALDP